MLVLAPPSVKPKYQKQGIGMALISEGHKIAKELGYQYSLVLGSELYYPKAGYISAKQLGIDVTEGFPSDNLWRLSYRKMQKQLMGQLLMQMNLTCKSNSVNQKNKAAIREEALQIYYTRTFPVKVQNGNYRIDCYDKSCQSLYH